jgi:hypothetical protein
MRKKDRKGPGIVTLATDVGTGFGTSEVCGVVVGVSEEDPATAAQTLAHRERAIKAEALSRKRDFTAGPSFTS